MANVGARMDKVGEAALGISATLAGATLLRGAPREERDSRARLDAIMGQAREIRPEVPAVARSRHPAPGPLGAQPRS